MPTFTSFADTLPDPVYAISDAGAQTGSSYGPGVAGVAVSSNQQLLRTRTNSGQLIARSPAFQNWSFRLEYNPLTRAQFAPIMGFLMSKQIALTPFFLGLPQYNSARDSSFDTYSQSNNLEAQATITAGSTKALIGKAGYSYTTNGTPKPGDMFTIDGTNSNHKKAYMVTATETNADYQSGETQPATDEVRIHFAPAMQKQVESADDFVFYRPKIKVVMSSDVIQYDLGVNDLYEFGLELEEVQ